MPRLAHLPPCPYCEGRGVLYDGPPDALGTPEYECDACHGTGRDIELERMRYEYDRMIMAGLR